jgi:hypothetical protein
VLNIHFSCGISRGAGGRARLPRLCIGTGGRCAPSFAAAACPHPHGMRRGRRTASAAPGLPFSHHWCAGFGRLRVRCAHTRCRRRHAPRAALTALAWGVGGSPPPWQKGRPGVGACEVSSVFWFTIGVLLFEGGGDHREAPEPGRAPRFREVRGPAEPQPHGASPASEAPQARSIRNVLFDEQRCEESP